ncbi:MAG: hydantoinase/oxoprolinase family protein [Bryobacteraceae bacterium]
MRIGVDAGGTFTDFVAAHEDGRIESFKIRSNRSDPAAVILEGIARAAGNARAVEVTHGSTVATNALLERKGAVTAFVTTAGFEDLLAVARQNRRELYNLTPAPPRPIVPRDLCAGIAERTLHDGALAISPSEERVAGLARHLRRAGVQSVAICFLHSYGNAQNEREAAQWMRKYFSYVSASHEVAPEFREYERASTVAINAYVGPLMDRYLERLEAALGRGRRLTIMQSNGGVLSAAQARRHAVRTVLSGPAGGVIAASEMARRSGFTRILGFDMGGTSTDVSLCDGEPAVTLDAAVDGFPVRIPMLDIHTVGAGGGSVARVDAGGLLRVGPESAGADPGPACYGTGDRATVTDAHVVLGRIAASQLLAGAMEIDPERSRKALGAVAEELGLSVDEAAAGIVRVANANMERAIRAVSLERGHDPREFTLVAFGGGGGLHACELASQLGMPAVLAPRFAEGLSALGMLLADAVRDYAAGVMGRSDHEREFRRLEAAARKEARGAEITRSADLRYQGQSYELTAPWESREKAEAAFHYEHARVYGYANPDRAVEVVTLRVRSRVASPKLDFRAIRGGKGTAGERRVFLGGKWQTAAVHTRESMRGAARGPALVLDYGSTVAVPPGWSARVDRVGALVLRRG